MSVLPEVYMCTTHMPAAYRGQKKALIGSLGTGVMDGCEPHVSNKLLLIDEP